MLAVEPSATMRAQRPAGAAPVIAARAEALPLDDDAVDAAMACVTIHHWEPPQAGLAELRRVARGPVVVFTFDLDAPARLAEGVPAPRGVEMERPRFPSIEDVVAALGRSHAGRADRDAGGLHRRVLRGVLAAPRGAARPRGAQRRSRCGRWSSPGVEERIVGRLARRAGVRRVGRRARRICARRRASTARCGS